MAIYKGHTEIVKILLKNGANMNDKDRQGNTALKLARKHKRREIVSLIKKYIHDKLMKDRLNTALIIKKGLTQKGDKLLLRYAHREMIQRIASFF